MAEKMLTAAGPMGNDVSVSIESIDHDALEFLEGMGGFGNVNNPPHPEYFFGGLDSKQPSTKYKIKRGWWTAIDEDMNKRLESDGFFLPNTGYDLDGHLSYNEVLWVYQSWDFRKRIDRAHIQKTLGGVSSEVRRTQAQRDSLLRAAQGRFKEHDLQMKVTDDHPSNTLIEPVPEKGSEDVKEFMETDN